MYPAKWGYVLKTAYSFNLPELVFRFGLTLIDVLGINFFMKRWTLNLLPIFLSVYSPPCSVLCGLMKFASGLSGDFGGAPG